MPRDPSEPTNLLDLLGYGSSFTRSDLFRLTRHMAVRMADPDVPDEEMRLIRMVVKALDEIAKLTTKTSDS